MKNHCVYCGTHDGQVRECRCNVVKCSHKNYAIDPMGAEWCQDCGNVKVTKEAKKYYKALIKDITKKKKK